MIGLQVCSHGWWISRLGYIESKCRRWSPDSAPFSLWGAKKVGRLWHEFPTFTLAFYRIRLAFRYILNDIQRWKRFTIPRRALKPTHELRSAHLSKLWLPGHRESRAVWSPRAIRRALRIVVHDCLWLPAGWPAPRDHWFLNCFLTLSRLKF